MKNSRTKVIMIDGQETWNMVASEMTSTIRQNLGHFEDLHKDNELHLVLPNGSGLRVSMYGVSTLAVMPGRRYTEDRGKLDWDMSDNGTMIRIDQLKDDSTEATRLARLSIMRANK